MTEVKYRSATRNSACRFPCRGSGRKQKPGADMPLLLSLARSARSKRHTTGVCVGKNNRTFVVVSTTRGRVSLTC